MPAHRNDTEKIKPLEHKITGRLCESPGLMLDDALSVVGRADVPSSAQRRLGTFLQPDVRS